MPYFDFLAEHGSRLLTGTGYTIILILLSTILAVIIAFVMGVMRMSRNWIVNGLAFCYIELFRGTSLLVQLFWIFYVLPLFGLTLNPFPAGFIAIGMNLGAYGAEIVRGAILSVPKGQWEAGIAINMPYYQSLRRIIIPQAILLMLPAWGNLLIELLKGTALVALISVTDLMFEARQINAITYLSAQVFGTALIIYYILARFMLTPFMRWFERFMARKMGRA